MQEITLTFERCYKDKEADINMDFMYTTKFYTGELITYFANLKNNKDLLNKILDCFTPYDVKASVEDYFKKCFKSLKEIIPDKFAEIILMSTQNNYILKKKKSSVLAQNKELNINFHILLLDSYTMAEAISEANDDSKIKLMFSNLFSFSGNLYNSVNYGIEPVIYKNKLILIDLFNVKSELAAIHLDAVGLFKSNIVIKKCENCGKFFIPTSRNDEKYCDNIFRNNKTCKELGYYEKVINNDVLKTYRTIYKTQNARKQRNKDNIPDVDYRFKQWVEFAKKELEKCKKAIITVEEFKNNISKDSWLRGD